MQAAEKEEDSKRSEQEEWRLSYQADELDGKLVKLCRQESCLNRKISNLRAEKTRLSTEKWQTEIVISEANLDIQLYDHPRGKLVDLVDQVETKTKEADLLRSRAYN